MSRPQKPAAATQATKGPGAYCEPDFSDGSATDDSDPPEETGGVCGPRGGHAVSIGAGRRGNGRGKEVVELSNTGPALQGVVDDSSDPSEED